MLPVDEITQRFALGDARSLPEAVSGGGSHEVWRFETTTGIYAVKVMSNIWDNPDWLAWLEKAFEVERAAARAGVSMPKPVLAPGCNHPVVELAGVNVRVHEWVQAHPIRHTDVTPAIARQIGSIIGELHGLGLVDFEQRYLVPIERRPDSVWAGLVDEVRMHDPAGELLMMTLDATNVVRDAEAVVGAYDPRSEAELLMTHGDVDVKNVLIDGSGRVVLVDWDVAHAMVARHEIVRAGLDFAGWQQGPVDKATLAETLDAYRARRSLETITTSDLATAFRHQIDWVVFNFQRAIGLKGDGPGQVHLGRQGAFEAGNQLCNMLRAAGKIEQLTT